MWYVGWIDGHTPLILGGIILFGGTARRSPKPPILGRHRLVVRAAMLASGVSGQQREVVVGSSISHLLHELLLDTSIVHSPSWPKCRIYRHSCRFWRTRFVRVQCWWSTRWPCIIFPSRQPWRWYRFHNTHPFDKRNLGQTLHRAQIYSDPRSSCASAPWRCWLPNAASGSGNRSHHHFL